MLQYSCCEHVHCKRTVCSRRHVAARRWMLARTLDGNTGTYVHAIASLARALEGKLSARSSTSSTSRCPQHPSMRSQASAHRLSQSKDMSTAPRRRSFFVGGVTGCFSSPSAQLAAGVDAAGFLRVDIDDMPLLANKSSRVVYSSCIPMSHI